MDVTLFYNVYENLRTSLALPSVAGPVPGTRIIPIVFENRMKGETYGAEISATAKLTDGWNLVGAYSNTPVILGVTFPNVVSPYLGLYARVAWRPRKHWEVAVVV